MGCGLIWYVSGWKRLGEAGLRPATASDPAAAKRDARILRIGLGVAAAALGFGALAAMGIIPVTVAGLGAAFGWILALTPVCLFPALFFFGGFDKAEKRRLVVIMVLFFGAAVFWSVFEQAGSTLTLFGDSNTEAVLSLPFELFFALVLAAPDLLAWRWRRGQAGGASATVFASVVTLACAGAAAWLLLHRGDAFPSSFFQSANALFIVALSPVFAALWVYLGNRQPSSPAKFAIGLLFAGLGFAILIPIAGSSAKVSPLWLTATYMLHTIGELCLSPVGLSAMGRLAPRRIMGLVLGIWFLATSLGNFLAGFAASFYENMPLSRLFGAVAIVALIATALMAATIKPIRSLLSHG
jgi:POT family proton-dependent oligopeptide transporter